jgi:IS5 family transposase
MPGEEPSTEQLQAVQVERVREEMDAADRAPDADETAQHVRRADKASYLRDKLAERRESEQDQPVEDKG